MDETLFRFINQTTSNPVFDAFFPWWTNVNRTPIFLWLFLPLILIVTFYFARWRGLAWLATASLLTWAVDSLVSVFLKSYFLRPRPYDVMTDVIVRIGKPYSTSFPSGHSLDWFFLAVFMSAGFPRLRWLFYLFAVLIGYSRIYNGVHYPTDVLGGAVIGALTALILLQPMKYFDARLLKGRPS